MKILKLFQFHRIETGKCSRFLKGVCKAGSRCKYPHTDQQLRIIERKKLEKCPGYFEFGFCTYGPYCLHSHEVPKVEDKIKGKKDSKHDDDWWKGPGLV
jgi:hypothetical protein